jgi:hypothetical protein
MSLSPAASTTVQRVINRAARAGLNPTITDASRGVVAVHLDAPGADAGFGVIRYGARSGRILTATIYNGNNDPRISAGRYAARQHGYRGAMRALAAYETHRSTR